MSEKGTWLDERAGWKAIWDTVFLRKIPKVNWFYTLGSATLVVAINQGITGILLTLYYVPSPDQAWASVNYITNELAFGSFIRGLHHWGSSLMVILVVLHMVRVFVMGAFKYPREITWMSGVVLLILTLGFGFTGYLLPWDQKAYWATTVGTRIASVTPVIGDFLLKAMRGGEGLSALTLTRFYGVHIWVLPAVLLIFLGVHLYLVIRNGISAPPKKGN